MSKVWRILLLAHNGDTGGATYSISYLAKQLASEGHYVVLGCPAGCLLTRLMADSDVPVVPMRFRGRFDLRNSQHIVRLVREHNIEVVNSQTSYPRYTSLWGVRLWGLKVILLHHRRTMPLSIGLWGLYALHRGLRHLTVAVSNPVAEGMVRRGLSMRHIRVIPNGTPTQKYDYNEAAQEQTALLEKTLDIGNRVLVVAISRLKRQDQLLAALVGIKTPVALCLVGITEPKDFVAVRRRVEAQGHTVRYTGDVPNAESLAYLRLAKVKVLCSMIEGLSQGLLESMFIGTPVVATAVGGNLDLITPEVNGLLFEDGDIVGLRHCIDRLLTDEALAKRLAQAGQETAKAHSMGAVTRAYIKVIESI